MEQVTVPSIVDFLMDLNFNYAFQEIGVNNLINTRETTVFCIYIILVVYLLLVECFNY